MSRRTAAWVALPLGSLNVTLALSTLLFAGLNGYSLALLVEENLIGGAVIAGSISVVGALVASHRPRNPIGWIFLAVGFSEGLATFAYPYAEYALVTKPGSLPGGPLMSWLAQLIWFPGFVLIFTFALLLFPDGRLPSRRWRPVGWISAVPLALFVLVAALLWPYRGRAFLEHPGRFMSEGLVDTLQNLMWWLALVGGLLCLISLIVRFRRSRGAERQQLKWFTYAAAFTLSIDLPVDSLFPALFGNLVTASTVILIPGAVGIAILRYRLYDIDVIINRTLVYGSLTVLLALVYFGGVALTETIFRALRTFITGQGEQPPQLAIIVSTLVIAALFNPLRRRIQSFIDRRFYRSKYDAAKTLETFSAKLRDETDLDALNADLVGVVNKTMQPAHVSLWLRPVADPRNNKERAAIREAGHDN
jgi:hypothetical protein